MFVSVTSVRPVVVVFYLSVRSAVRLVVVLLLCRAIGLRSPFLHHSNIKKRLFDSPRLFFLYDSLLPPKCLFHLTRCNSQYCLFVVPKEYLKHFMVSGGLP